MNAGYHFDKSIAGKTNVMVQTNLTPLHQKGRMPQVGQKSARARQSEQGDVKEEGIDLLVMPDD